MDARTELCTEGAFGKIDVTIIVSRIGKDYPYLDLVEWGSTAPDKEGAPTHGLIANILVTANGKPVLLPLSAFANLFWPTDAELRSKSTSEFELRIKGADAANSYRAIFSFSDGVLKSRRIHGLEFPEESWELTTYSYVPDDGR